MKKEYFRVQTVVLPTGRTANMHLAISDPTGDSAIFEYVNGKLVIPWVSSTIWRTVSDSTNRLVVPWIPPNQTLHLTGAAGRKKPCGRFMEVGL